MKTIAVVASAVLIVAGVGIAETQEVQPSAKATNVQAVKKQTICPIEGGEVRTNLFADFGGKRVYFCCASCPAEFKKNPAKYIAKMEKDGITLDKTPAEVPAAK